MVVAWCRARLEVVADGPRDVAAILVGLVVLDDPLHLPLVGHVPLAHRLLDLCVTTSSLSDLGVDLVLLFLQVLQKSPDRGMANNHHMLKVVVPSLDRIVGSLVTSERSVIGVPYFWHESRSNPPVPPP